ncbi:hypothetical protein O6H91_22G055200 [Diphasiastrum complanatum]|nr:hypothetical protein O6H91_22G055200 [Diphasiastrum complanatum]
MKQLLDLDRKWSLGMHQKGLKISRFWLRALEYSGDGTFWLPVTAGIWLAPIIKNTELRRFLFNLFAAFVFDLIVIGLIKSIVQRPRPVYNKGMYVVLAVDRWSFPSGHSSRALMIATLFLFYLPLWQDLMARSVLPYLGENESFRSVGLPCLELILAPLSSLCVLVWAAATASSRVLLGRHYFFDVLVGSILGVLEAAFVHKVLYVPGHFSEACHELLRLTAANIYSLVTAHLYY